MKKFQARCIAEIINSGIQPYQNLNVINRISKDQGKEKKQEWVQFYLKKGLNSIEEILKMTHTGKYCVGNAISIADIFLGEIKNLNSAIFYVFESYSDIFQYLKFIQVKDMEST